MQEIKEGDENFDKIKVFYSEDEKLKVLGELLSNKSSRDILRLLIDKEMYTNEIAKKLELRVNLVVHHLQKMESIGLLEITNKKIIRKGEEHRFFRIPHGVLIVPNESKEATGDGFFKRLFKNGAKFTAIGVIGGAVWLSDIASLLKTKEVYPVPFGESVQTDPLIPALVVIIACLLIERTFSFKKKKRVR